MPHLITMRTIVHTDNGEITAQEYQVPIYCDRPHSLGYWSTWELVDEIHRRMADEPLEENA